jgi:hypothetical protein
MSSNPKEEQPEISEEQDALLDKILEEEDEVETTPESYDTSEDFDIFNESEGTNDFYDDFHSVPSIETPKKKSLPVIPIIAAVCVIIALIVLLVAFSKNDKRTIKKVLKAYQQMDGEAYADLLKEEQIKNDMEYSGKDYTDDEDVEAFYSDYLKDSYLLSDQNFSYEIIDSNEIPKKILSDYNDDFYHLESMTEYTIKILYDDYDKYAYQYCEVLIGKDKDL